MIAFLLGGLHCRIQHALPRSLLTPPTGILTDGTASGFSLLRVSKIKTIINYVLTSTLALKNYLLTLNEIALDEMLTADFFVAVSGEDHEICPPTIHFMSSCRNGEKTNLTTHKGTIFARGNNALLSVPHADKY